MNPILFAIPFFFLLIGIELLIGKLRGKNWYRLNDTITNLNIGIGNQVFSVSSKFIILGVYAWGVGHLAVIHQPIAWWSFILALLLFDFLFYWAHRWSHTVNFLWGAHVVHHQSEEYNLSVALRQSWIHNIIALFIFLPLPILGFDPKIFLLAAATHTLFQFWIHTKAINKLPWIIEFIFNTPSHHRVHHGINPKYIDKNHAGVLIIWDRMFGTFQLEEEEPIYGITTPINSWNPTWANIHYYAEMVAKASKMNRLKDKLYMLIAKPGWLPNEMGGYQDPLAVDPANYKIFDTATNWSKKLYVLAQFVLIAGGLIMFMTHFETITLAFKILFFAALLISITICGGIFENKPWVKLAEYTRLLLIAVVLNSYYYYAYIDWFKIMLIASTAGVIVFTTWFTLSWLFEKKLSPQAIKR